MSSAIEFSYFTGNESEMLTFYRIPKLLVTDEYFKKLSSDAKLLYGLMLDRMSLSAKNGWIDKENHVYIYFSIEDAMELLACGKNKAVKTMAELDNKDGIGLIERRRQGQGKPTLIYVMNFISSEVKTDSEVYNLNFKKFQNQTSRSPENKLQEVYKENPNNNKYNNTECSNKSNLIRWKVIDEDIRGGSSDVAGYSALVKENIEYSSLIERFPYEQDMINEIYELILETVLSQKENVYIARDCYPADLVKSRFLKLNYSHIEYVLGCMKDNTSRIRNIKKYILAALFNAPATMGNFYQAEVNHDMENRIVKFT
ncbi:Replication initiator protein A (RepA) N-terminus [Lachnospiraceae bacterium]|nr:Replication initiator protein A (RepA) N-terminus [Lachnospiraceae bacterium]